MTFQHKNGGFSRPAIGTSGHGWVLLTRIRIFAVLLLRQARVVNTGRSHRTVVLSLRCSGQTPAPRRDPTRWLAAYSVHAPLVAS
jgi:hypothetical protein